MNKFMRRMCLALSLVLCLSLMATSVFAAEPAADQGNSRMVTVTYEILVENETGDDLDSVILGTEQIEVEYGTEFIDAEELSNIPEGYKLLSSLGIRIYDHQTEVSAYLTLDPDAPIKPTEPETKPDVTEPETKPDETVPETKPDETVPETKPDETVPETKPEETVPETKPNETVPETKPSETTPATNPDADNSGKDDVPKTGDESHLMLWTAVASVSLIGVGAVVFTMKKKATR